MISREAQRIILAQCYAAAAKSPDPSTQNGAVLVGPFGVLSQTYAINDFPRGVRYTPERWKRPRKYAMIEHAERNVIYTACRLNVATEGTTMVCPWAACADCARAIIQVGIIGLVRVPAVEGDTASRWDESCAIGDEMLREAGVEIVEFDGAVGGPPVRRNGKAWKG